MSKNQILVRLLSLGLLASGPLLARADERRDDVHRDAPRVRRHHRVVHRVVEERRPDGDIDRRDDHRDVQVEHRDDPR
jgi:hypothetical protein